MSKLRRIALYWNTMRHLRSQQVFGRAVECIRRTAGLGRPADPPASLHVPPERSLPDVPERIRVENRTAQDAISEGTFVFLNDRRPLGRPVDWTPDAPALWTFHLHYFNYLPGLDRSLRADLCRDWIQSNPAGSDPGWHPYPTSLRVINWCRAAPREPDILGSLYRQASYLYRHVETHLLGNHLLENARALVLAGHFFGEQGEAPSWNERGLRIYRDETPEQVLGDGGHYERSPMYHALVLEGYLDVLAVLPDEHPDRPFFDRTVRRMMDFLDALTHPNGRIALFNDSVQGEARLTHELRAYASEIIEHEPEAKAAFPETGYYVHDDEDLYLVIDAGPVGPDHLPAHAHADIFSYELYLGDTPFIVDTGTYEYEPGPMRDYTRSTRAHNTVCVDGVDQAECWDSFRVARRYAPEDVTMHEHGDVVVFDGTFTGYAHLIGDGIVHRRCIRSSRRHRRVQVTDYVAGDGSHTVTSRLHLHPEVSVRLYEDGIRLASRERAIELSTGDSQVRLEKEWYCPEFGIRKKAPVLVVQKRGRLPLQLRHTIQY